MPEETATKLDLRTSRIARKDRVHRPLVHVGYEVHVNLSTVIVHDGGSIDGEPCSTKSATR